MPRMRAACAWRNPAGGVEEKGLPQIERHRTKHAVLRIQTYADQAPVAEGNTRPSAWQTRSLAA